MARMRWLMATLALGTAVQLGAAPKASLHVDKTRPARSEQYFRYGQQPEGLAHKLKDEAGVCDYQYGIQLEILTEQPRFALRSLTATVVSIKVVLGLRSTLWLSERGGERIRAHEEAHRAICEQYYAHADQVAFAVAQKRLGLKITVPKSAGEAGIKAELGKIQQQMMDEYTRSITEPCEFAEHQFDLLTDHSRNDLANDKAIAQAIEQERARFATPSRQ